MLQQSVQRPLPPGTVIEFCGDLATVKADTGDNTVRVQLDDGYVTNWYWNFQGICCTVVSLPDEALAA